MLIPRIGLVLAVLAIGLIPASVLAQNYPCPNGPGPGERQVGMAGGGNSGSAPFPICESNETQSGASTLQFYWVDNFVAVAWHRQSPHTWAVSRGRSQKEAENGALALCEAAMKEKCTIASQVANGSIAIARSHLGALSAAWGSTAKEAKITLLTQCRRDELRCTIEQTFTGKPWEQLAGTTPPFRLVEYVPPPGATLHNMYGSMSWTVDNTNRAVWFSGGHRSLDESERSAIAECERSSNSKCKVAKSNINGVILMSTDSRDTLIPGSGQSAREAESGTKTRCKELKQKCETLAVFDVRQPGVVTRTFPLRAAKQ